MKIILSILKGIFQSSIGKWILYALIGLVLFKIFTFVLGIFFPPAAFILSNIVWIAIVVVGIYFFVKFKNSDKPKVTILKATPGLAKKDVITKIAENYGYDYVDMRETKPEKKSELDELFDIVDEES